MINITCIFAQLLRDLRNQVQTLFECSGHQVPVDFCKVNIYPGMYTEIIVMLPFRRIIVRFKFLQDHFEFTKMPQIKKGIQHIVHAFHIVTRFNGNHQRFLFEKINPFLCIPVIHQEILADKCKPAVTLVEIKFLVKIIQL